jgi:multiple sugar transport system substrate-binding protein
MEEDNLRPYVESALGRWFPVRAAENVRAKAMRRVVNDKVPVDKAVDELIARIKEVAG